MLNSLNKKIIFILLLLGLSLLLVLFVQIIPKMHKQQEDFTKQQIDNSIYLTTQQLKLATKALYQEGETKREYRKSIIETTVDNAEDKISNSSYENTQKYIDDLSNKLHCSVEITDKNQNIVEGWSYQQPTQKSMCPQSPNRIFYTKRIENTNKAILLSCKAEIFIDKHLEFEYKLKKDIQNSFLLNENIHKGKTYLMWINEKKLKTSTAPLYDLKDDDYFNNKYCLSKTSGILFPRTGTLTGKQIIDSIDKEPIVHLLDKDENRGEFNSKAVTWVRSIGGDTNRRLLYITTVFEDDFDSKIDTSFKSILPVTLFSFLLIIAVGFFIMRRVFKNINKLSEIAYLVHNGDITVRSNIKGKDDLGVLGMTFDNMLNSIEKNMQVLDEKVATRTSELNLLLEEKETLLKEIHHRVKNNLAMTIELIKIQKIKIKDDTTKTALGDIQERIHVMELLHRKLYESKNLSSIDINKYIKELVSDVSDNFCTQKNIKVDVDIIDGYYMDIDYALPCGLIINEAMTNSFKHAFDDEYGKISISLDKQSDQFILIISDNGKGIKNIQDIKNSKTLGFRLISNIVNGQLLGSLEYENKNGIILTIKFKSV